MKKPVFVGSVFAGGDRDSSWLRLQRRQLELTVGPRGFEHVVHLGSRADPGMFSDSIVLGQSVAAPLPPGARHCPEHLDGLLKLVEFAQQEQDRYSGFLILDSDAFPITPRWQRRLDKRFEKLGKSCAAVVRTENTDTFPHPCVVYAKEARFLRFGVIEAKSLMGRDMSDISSLEPNVLPLLKSNALSPHPVLATVYYRLFYHHGCGSRGFYMRGVTTGYYDAKFLRQAPPPEDLFDALHADPDGYLGALNGSAWEVMRGGLNWQPSPVPESDPAPEQGTGHSS